MMPMIAHQGGWDEAIYVAVPLVIFAALLRIAKGRAQHEAEAEVQARSRGEAGDTDTGDAAASQVTADPRPPEETRASSPVDPDMPT
ncbi:MAG: hypothetical protein HYR89_03915 [Actinobacteria bacterium]|nr:hypothetical protein [Actinomycetota bacterium]